MAYSIDQLPVTLQQLFPQQSLESFSNCDVGILRLDSRQVQTGDTFVAVTGHHLDGRQFISSALERGATVVLQDSSDGRFSVGSDAGVVRVMVPNLKAALSAIAANYYASPSISMKATAITGTNGKTTCSMWLAQLLNELGESSAILGTLGYGKVDSDLITTGMTTPDAIETQRILSELSEQNVSAVVAEVSSHSLDQSRVDGVEFDVAVVTNISRDHLDYHGDMKSYTAAKTKLMAFKSLKSVVLNVDDDYCDLFKSAVVGARIFTYSIQQSADFYTTDVRASSAGISAELHTPEGLFNIVLPVWGLFNLSNVLAVIVAVYAQGFNLPKIIAALKVLQPVPGRLEPVDVPSDISVLVDFAHTPEALSSVLTALRQHTRGAITCVFGCGGDRDKGKRPLMAEAAEQGSDVCVVTSDNPRSENAKDIINDVLSGIKNRSAVEVIINREEAINFALANAQSGDCVLLAGKGHEDYQHIGEDKIPFSDMKVARLALRKRMEVLQ